MVFVDHDSSLQSLTLVCGTENFKHKLWKLCFFVANLVFFFKYAVSYVVSHVINNIALQPHSAASFCYCQSFFHSVSRQKLFFGNDIFGQETIAMGPMIVKWCAFKQKPNLLRLLFLFLASVLPSGMLQMPEIFYLLIIIKKSRGCPQTK